MISSDFARVLDEIIDQLEMTRAQFAKEAKVSHSMVAKLLAGDEARRSTYKKVFACLSKTHPALAQKLLRAFLRDLVAGVAPGVRQEDPVVSNKRALAILDAFSKRSTRILLALDVLGRAAETDEEVHNALMSMAALVSKNTLSDAVLGSRFFTPALIKPAVGRKPGQRREFQLVGGTLGEFIAELNDEE